MHQKTSDEDWGQNLTGAAKEKPHRPTNLTANVGYGNNFGRLNIESIADLNHDQLVEEFVALRNGVSAKVKAAS